jgi:formamidopyrimidine-DNA glycosylase
MECGICGKEIDFSKKHECLKLENVSEVASNDGLCCAHCDGDIESTTLMGQVIFHCEQCGAETRFTTVGLHIDKQKERFKRRAT